MTNKKPFIERFDWIAIILLLLLGLSVLIANSQVPVKHDLTVTGSVVSDRQLLTPGNIGSGAALSASTSITIGDPADPTFYNAPDTTTIVKRNTATAVTAFEVRNSANTPIMQNWANGYSFFSRLSTSAGSGILDVSNANTYQFRVRANGDVVIGATGQSVVGLTVLSNIHAGGSITSPSSRELKDNVRENPVLDSSRDIKTIEFTWPETLEDKTIRDFTDIIDEKGIVLSKEDQYSIYQRERQADTKNASIVRYGVDIDDPSVPEAVKVYGLYGRPALGHGEAIGYLLNKIVELEKRIAALEAK